MKHKLLAYFQLVNHVYFSPDGQWVASASFDKSVKLWNGITGKFVAAFRGHVGPVYQIRFVSFNLFIKLGLFHLISILKLTIQFTEFIYCFPLAVGLLIVGFF